MADPLILHLADELAGTLNLELLEAELQDLIAAGELEDYHDREGTRRFRVTNSAE